jgi:hypothetical protein
MLSLLCALLVIPAGAATYKLTNGQTVTGDLVEAGSDEGSALINVGDGKYERVPWGQFDQDALKSLLDRYGKNKKIADNVEPFIEVTQEERAAKTEVRIAPKSEMVIQLEEGRNEPKASIIGSLFKSSVGLFLVVLIYGANIYAGFEIGIFRARPKALVAGLAAVPVLGFLSNIVFLSMPTRIEGMSEEEIAAAEAARLEPTPTIAIPGQAEAVAEQQAAAAQAVAEGPKLEVYARGKFTFNKRFFETKFAGFFGMTRSDENKPKVLIIKSTKGEFVVERITRITPSDLFVQAAGRVGETSMHFSEIIEVVLKPHA